ncbi:MAG: 2-oxo-tetronate isomerase [Bosea sp. (in: a-proteobacteria)]
MPRFAANLSMMFTEWAFLDRFKAAADAGFAAVEFLFPYEHPPEAVARALTDNRLEQALFNLSPGDWDKGERGMASHPGREAEFRASVATALVYAKATGAKRLHMMAGLADAADPRAEAAYLDSLRFAADALGAEELELMLEPINSRDMPGFFLNDFGQAARLIGLAGRANVKLQYDVYHRQIIHGDVVIGLRQMLPIVGHIQIASVPSRHEPDIEELNYPFIFDELDRLGYAGFVGCEYRPKAGTLAGLGWFAPFRRQT